MYKLKNLVETVNSTQAEINGKWVPARPEPFYGSYGLMLKIKDAWAVFRGRADAFTWPEGQ